jgi:hypothetical protein
MPLIAYCTSPASCPGPLTPCHIFRLSRMLSLSIHAHAYNTYLAYTRTCLMDPRIIFKGFQATSASQAPGHTPFTSSIPIRIHYQALPGSYTLT